MKVKVIFDATKANDEYVAKVYSMILEQASSVSKQRADMFTKMMSHKTIKIYLVKILLSMQQALKRL